MRAALRRDSNWDSVPGSIVGFRPLTSPANAWSGTSRPFAERAGYEVVATYKETASGVRLDRAERRKVLVLAQRREIDAVLVTELSRWGRSTTDLLATLKELEAQRVSLVALNGMAFDLTTPHGRMMATLLAGIADYAERVVMRSDAPAVGFLPA